MPDAADESRSQPKPGAKPDVAIMLAMLANYDPARARPRSPLVDLIRGPRPAPTRADRNETRQRKDARKWNKARRREK